MSQPVSVDASHTFILLRYYMMQRLSIPKLTGWRFHKRNAGVTDVLARKDYAARRLFINLSEEIRDQNGYAGRTAERKTGGKEPMLRDDNEYRR